MAWLVTGASGLLGTEVVSRLRSSGADVVALSRADLDIRDEGAVRETLRRRRPRVIVNCAAWTAVDDAEYEEDGATAVNGTAVGNLVRSAARIRARLIHVSTDAVFDGAASVPYAEDATPAPVNAYGRSKLAGERAVLEGSGQYGYVVRTAWLYGARGRDFVRTMIRIAAGHGAVDVVADQWGQPTWVADVAERILLLGGGDAPGGVYHATNAGQTSRWGLAREVFLRLGTDPGRVRAVSGADLARPARRGAYTVLGHARWAAAGIPPPRHWRAALSAAWPDLRAAIDEIEL